MATFTTSPQVMSTTSRSTALYKALYDLYQYSQQLTIRCESAPRIPEHHPYDETVNPFAETVNPCDETD